MNWDAIFKKGTWTDANGATRDWSDNDINTLVKNTDENVPIVIRHPKDQSKAFEFGKTAGFRVKDGVLQTQYKDVPDLLKIAVKEGLKLAKSVSIDPGTMKIRHIGLLGAGQPPAVEGLGAFNCSAEDEGDSLLTYMFNPNTNKEGQMDPKDKKIQELENKIKSLEAGKETQKLQDELGHAKGELKKEQDAHTATKQEFSKFKKDRAEDALKARVDALAESGRIKPVEKKKVLGFAKAMDADTASMEFSAPDGTKENVSPQENYLRDLEARQENKDGLLTEFAGPDNAGPAAESGDDFADINDYA